MKLHEIIAMLGLSAEDKQKLSQSIDEYKKEFEAKINTKFAKYDEYKAKVEEIEKSNFDAKLKDAFVKAGGREEKFASFLKVAGKIEDIEKFDFASTFEEFENLKVAQQEKQTYNGNPLKSISNFDKQIKIENPVVEKELKFFNATDVNGNPIK